MDPDFLLIIIMIITTTAIAFAGINGIVAKVLDYKREKQQMLTGGGAKSQEIADRTDLIEDRLRVLERLATDKGALLSDEIEALRDESRLAHREQEAH